MSVPLTRHQQAVLRLHLDPHRGSAHWVAVAKERGITAADLQTFEDLAQLGIFDADALRRRPIEEFVPASLLRGGLSLTPFCTGGTTDAPCWSVFTDEEFELAFVSPFFAGLSMHGLRWRGRWLFLGPAGSHPIGRAAWECGRRASGHPPFAIDLDPGWARRLQGFAGERYLDHVVSQALQVLHSQNVQILFGTPTVLRALAEQLSQDQRAAISGVHHGGMAASGEEMLWLQHEGYPRATFLGGYGNSLLGMSPEIPQEATESSPELRDGTIRLPSYVAEGNRLCLRVVPPDAAESLVRGQDPGEVAIGERGRVLAYRFDPSFLILNHLERDEAERRGPCQRAQGQGWQGTVVHDPRPALAVAHVGEGLY